MDLIGHVWQISLRNDKDLLYHPVLLSHYLHSLGNYTRTCNEDFLQAITISKKCNVVTKMFSSRMLIKIKEKNYKKKIHVGLWYTTNVLRDQIAE